MTGTSDSRYLISGSEDRSIKIFDLQTKQEVHHFENAHKSMEIYIYEKFIFLGRVASVAVTSDDKYVVSGSWDKSLKVFDLQTRQQVHHFENAHKGMENYIDYKFILLGKITSVAITSDDKYVICGSTDESIKVFDLRTKQQVHHFENAHNGMEIYIDCKFIFF